MSKTQQEIFSQHISLRQTYAFLEGSAVDIKDFFAMAGFYSVTFTGCGASYALCRSAELSLKVRGGLTTMSYPAGDLMMNMPYYHDMLNGSLMIAPSRSGSTIELVEALESAREEAGALVMGLTATPGSPLSRIAHLALEMPWILDEGACGTRSVSNFYAANLYNIGLLAGDNKLLEEIHQATDNQEAFIERYSAELEGIGMSGTWDNIIVLADAELAGVSEAGSIAIERMARIASHHCHILNMRHDKILMVTPRTLVIAAVSPLDNKYQRVLFDHLRARGAQILTISSHDEAVFACDLNIMVPDYTNYAVRGIPVLFVLQAIAYFRALADGKHPDADGEALVWEKL